MSSVRALAGQANMGGGGRVTAGNRSSSVAAAVAVALTLGLGSTGCTFIGLGIGAAIPDRREVPLRGYRLAPGDRLWLVMNDGRVPTGTFVRQSYDEIVLSENGAEHGYQRAEMRTIEIRQGSYAETGAGVGLIIDLAIIVATAVALSNINVN